MNEVAVGQVFLITLGLHLPIIIASIIDYFFISHLKNTPIEITVLRD